MRELIPQLLHTDYNSLLVVAVVCAVAVFLVKGALPHSWLVLVVFPAFMLATLAADLLLRELGLQPSADKTVNLAFASGAGIIASFGLFTALFWLYSLRSR
jgi:hypothetical protein